MEGGIECVCAGGAKGQCGKGQRGAGCVERGKGV